MFSRLYQFFLGIHLVFRETILFGRDVRELYYRDPLTGVFNRRAFLDLGQQAVDAAMRNSWVLTVVSIDLDSLKQTNDQHGHTQGDKQLQEFGQALRDNLRPTDYAGRVGGDEFLLILPNTNMGGVRRLIERLRKLYPHIPFSAGMCTESFSWYSQYMLEEMIHRADQEMYREKNSKKAA